MSVIPVLLAGGSGSRLWPISRKSYPKQFSKFVGDSTLFQQSALRLTSSVQVEFSSPITVTNYDFRFIVAEQLQAVGLEAGHILIEPEPKNTAPAILIASLFAKTLEDEPVLLVAPSDHVISGKNEFHAAVCAGLGELKDGNMVTFGIAPTYPETGYGYLELQRKQGDRSRISKVSRFVEKPCQSDAEHMIEMGNYLWNSGMFLFKADDIIEAFQKYFPDALTHVVNALNKAEVDLDFLRISPDPWAKLDNISIDYAIMEKATNLVAVSYSSEWSDLGSWESVWLEAKKDTSGTFSSKRAHAIDCTNSLLRAESQNQQVVGLGLDNIVAIAMRDAVLIANKNRAQDVKQVVEYLKSNNISQAEVFPEDYRPWGWFESLVVGDRFQVKRICVKPGAALSLQSHRYRSEHWIVVEGTAKVTINKLIKFVEEGQSVYVPAEAVHRLENPGDKLMVLIEVQIGSYLGEDDIIRYEDIYSRD